MKKIKILGFLGGRKHQSNTVYSVKGLLPTICSGGNRLKTYIYIVVRK